MNATRWESGQIGEERRDVTSTYIESFGVKLAKEGRRRKKHVKRDDDNNATCYKIFCIYIMNTYLRVSKVDVW